MTRVGTGRGGRGICMMDRIRLPLVGDLTGGEHGGEGRRPGVESVQIKEGVQDVEGPEKVELSLEESQNE